MASEVREKAIAEAARVMARTFWHRSSDLEAERLPVDPAWLASMRAAIDVYEAEAGLVGLREAVREVVEIAEHEWTIAELTPAMERLQRAMTNTAEGDTDG